jgi:hypothetical protein
MLTADELNAWREQAAENAELAALLEALRRRTSRLRVALPPLPRGKAMLSRDGGVCPDDGRPLRFDPWEADRHGCPKCGKTFTGDRHHGHWARSQYLWLAERMVDLALLAALEDDLQCAARLDELLAWFEDQYFACPNRDNVLGPTHLFFSTYLESLWVTHWLGAAFLAREAGLLSEERVEGVNRVADEAATLIGEFNEGLSNRQTWHAAALTAIAAWFGDEELAGTGVESRTGLLGHLADGFGEDGLWWEGENYHLFALRGLVVGLQWARVIGFDLLESPEVQAHFTAALLAPGWTALPDLTFPARKDARYGMSLAHPAFREVLEVGRAWVAPSEELDRWIGALRSARPSVAYYDAWLHEADQPGPQSGVRSDLSPLVLAAMAREPATAVSPWEPASRLLETQGLVVLRHGDRYASLECGVGGGGHGHPDQLHLTLHAAGVHWLPDPGAGSYVDQSLFWYRSARAHNAPIVNGTAPGGRVVGCAGFDSQGPWGWGRGKAGDVTRTIIAGPDHLVDIVELASAGSAQLELPWHLNGEVSVSRSGRWEPVQFEGPAVSRAEKLVPEGPGPIVLSVRSPGGQVLQVHLPGEGELLRAWAPGLPDEEGERVFYLQRVVGPARLVAVLDLATGDRAATDARVSDAEVEVVAPAGTTSYRFTITGVTIVRGSETVDLGGLRAISPHRESSPGPQVAWDVMGNAPHAWTSPPCDGTLDGFDTSAPLELAGEHQYRRSEEPYDENFGAEAWVNWDREALYLAAAVRKPDVVVRGESAPPLELDNEPDEIHVDGLQVYLQSAAGESEGRLVTLREGGGLRCRGTGDRSGEEALDVAGGWATTDDGYLVTVRWDQPALAARTEGDRVGFDLIVNEARPERKRRAGQLVWSGGEGWVYLQGDRRPPQPLGALVLG